MAAWPRQQGSPAPAEGAAARVPAGEAVYAVGDVHGRLDLLTALLGRIAADAALRPAGRRRLVFLGDYIDRGPGSRGVVERLVQGPPPGFEAICLRGNHEQAMLDFLEAPEQAEAWLDFGGEATLRSYGVRPAAPRQMRDALAAVLPAAHLRFLETLDFVHEAGGYLFVHAGIRPGRALEIQHPHDLLWIREAFLESGADHGCVVVHGHSIVPVPEVRSNRIGIDTGAFATGRLTCLVLEGAERRFLTT